MFDLIDLFVGNAQRAFSNYCSENPSPVSYCELLYQTHFYVKETVPVMTAVHAARMDHPLVAQLAVHCEEERGHDQLLLDDLRRLGLSPSGQESPPLRKLVNLEWSATQEPDPVSALFGHILVMEGYPPSEEDISRLVSTFGLSLDVAQGFLAHAEADVAHSETARALAYHPSIDRTVLLSRALATCRLLGEHWQWMATRQSHAVH
ncbi:iron-containing redox enzyme family protein [Rhodopseudomonas sp. RCAM05734]|uniref:iron-containing redox enzyme family protein n=1 Tax=Rhodopseudomonas sp. RCAM05734 TaxID=3457549 RepID=UPI004044427D